MKKESLIRVFWRIQCIHSILLSILDSEEPKSNSRNLIQMSYLQLNSFWFTASQIWSYLFPSSDPRDIRWSCALRGFEWLSWIHKLFLNMWGLSWMKAKLDWGFCQPSSYQTLLLLCLGQINSPAQSRYFCKYPWKSLKSYLCVVVMRWWKT